MKHLAENWRAGMDLGPADLDLFGRRFERTIGYFLPFANGPISLIAQPDDLASFNPRAKTAVMARAAGLGDQAAAGRWLKPVIVAAEGLVLLPLWCEEKLLGLAELAGVDPLIARQLSEDWLLDQGRLICREFGLLKQLAIDPLTGLLNSHHLLDELDLRLAEPAADPATLFLLELFPRAKDAEKAMQHVARAGYCLQSGLGGAFPLHHLAFGVFGLIWQNIAGQEAARIGEAMLGWLRRENFQQACVGIAPIPSRPVTAAVNAAANITAALLLDQAWQCLRVARRQGPYSVCSPHALSNPITRQLRTVPRALAAKLRRLWDGVEVFAVVLLRQEVSQGQDAAPGSFSKRARALLEAEAPVLPAGAREVYVFLAGADGQQALAWTQAVKKRLQGLGNLVFSGGIAGFPCGNFRKAETPLNARKALLHTGFFGPDTITIFDGVSLNVSGDIYYNEGELRRAIREYRQGLLLDPANVNLLNSLGEAYARLNRSGLAIAFFEKALELEPANYMALYNHGRGCLAAGKEGPAVASFEKALAVIGPAKLASRLRPAVISRSYADLVLQLGRLYCQAGQYSQAVALLADRTDLFEAGAANDKSKAAGPPKTGQSQGLGLVLGCLGVAYKGLGQNQKAMAVLQAAVRHNPRDAAALSLLGELYALENQGDDIARSLCRQAVALDDSHGEHWHRLAWISWRLGDSVAAKAALQESLRLQRHYGPALYLRGQICEREGKKAQAAKAYEKLLKLTPGHLDAQVALAKLQKQLPRPQKNERRRP